MQHDGHPQISEALKRSMDLTMMKNLGLISTNLHDALNELSERIYAEKLQKSQKDTVVASSRSVMDNRLLESLKRVGYKGANLDDAMNEMLKDTSVISHASVHRRAIVERYIGEAEKEISADVTKRELVIQVRPVDTDLIAVIHCMFIAKDYECECGIDRLIVKW